MNIKDKELIINNLKKLSNYYKDISKNNKTAIFKSYQYNKAIKSLKDYNGNINNNIDKLEGIGKSIKEKIKIILEKGTLNIVKEINKEPHIKSKRELEEILGIGPIISQKLINKNIYSITDLKKAVKNDKIKLSKMQRIGLKYYKDLKIEIPRDEILYLKNIIYKILNKYFKINIIIAGSYRLGKKYSNDIDLILTIDNIKTINDIKKNNIFQEILDILEDNNIIHERIDNKINSALVITKIPDKYKRYKPHIFRKIDIRFVPKDTLHFYLLYFGSGLYFSKKIRGIAKKQGYKLTQNGLYDKNNNLIKNIQTEKDIFQKLNIDYIKPEHR
jgi:DNA polymerase/3'-5' exonuclease PolX